MVIAGVSPETFVFHALGVARPHGDAPGHSAYIFLIGGLFFCIATVARAPDNRRAQPRRLAACRYFLSRNYAFDHGPARVASRGGCRIRPRPQVFDPAGLPYLCNRPTRCQQRRPLIKTSFGNGRSVSDAALTTRLNAAPDGDRRFGRGAAPHQNICRARASVSVGTSAGSARARQAWAGDDNPIETPPKLALPLPDKPLGRRSPPSTTNLSSDPEQDYFTDGHGSRRSFTALSRFPLAVCYRPDLKRSLTRAERWDVKQVSPRAWCALCPRRFPVAQGLGKPRAALQRN